MKYQIVWATERGSFNTVENVEARTEKQAREKLYAKHGTVVILSVVPFKKSRWEALAQ